MEEQNVGSFYGLEQDYRILRRIVPWGGNWNALLGVIESLPSGSTFSSSGYTVQTYIVKSSKFGQKIYKMYVI